MAGRPLRRLRNALRLNPLVGWEDMSGMSPATAWEPLAALVKPGAEAKYAEVYNRVGLPLAVVLEWGGNLSRSTRFLAQQAESTQIAKRLNAIVLSIPINKREHKPYYATPHQRRGSMFRISPYTPFVLLHRLGDMMADEVWRPRPGLLAVKEMQEELNDAQQEWGGNLSRGVDTAAGRMGVLGRDYLSDLWAKWLLTGRVAYSPTNPPPRVRKKRTSATWSPNMLRRFLTSGAATC